MGCQEIRLLQHGVQLSTVKIFYKNQYYRFFVFVMQACVQIMHYSIHKGSLCIFYISSDATIVIVRVFFLIQTHLTRIQIFHHCRICVILYSIKSSNMTSLGIGYRTMRIENCWSIIAFSF